MLNAVLWAITWGLLSIFVIFLVFGATVALYTFVRFYWSEIVQWQQRSRVAPESIEKVTAAAE
jgi:hypothetical protein